ncbi:hypothetical protein I350_07033 [Cryptococcus amylolentus CBS 6273]|uniref:Uncharacterized protein n=1 Tax=Cryptococcus amylolentus CBS 6273 TaxID=1296118 RepID=A0A1E3JHT7_9TREE|nr:hypothetical protein I350_07033 [Cryptococcus amylolentus CBS 6273]
MAGSLWNPDTASTVGRTPGLGYHTLDPSSDSVQTASVRPWRVAEGGAAALGPGELLEYQQIKWSRERDEAALKAALGMFPVAKPESRTKRLGEDCQADMRRRLMSTTRRSSKATPRTGALTMSYSTR